MDMSKYKLIAFDMDGTLLDSQKKVRQDSLDMIARAVSAGKIVTLSTGRGLPELTEYRSTLKDLQYIIGVSGALVVDAKNDREIYSQPLADETVHKILQEVKDIDVMIHMLSMESVVQKDTICHMADYHMGIYQGMFQKIAVTPDDIRAYYEQTSKPLYKLNLYFRNQAERTIVEKRLAPLGLPLVYAEATSLECSAPNVSKGHGLKKLCEYLNIPLEQTIAVGDADNDLDILKQAGLAVAMGNSNENVKAIADVIVADNDHGGCAQAIAEYLL